MKPPKNRRRLLLTIAAIVSTVTAILGPLSTLNQSNLTASSGDSERGSSAATNATKTERRFHGNLRTSGSVVVLPRGNAKSRRNGNATRHAQGRGPVEKMQSTITGHAHPTVPVSDVSSSPFERHYLSVYRSMMIAKNNPSKFILFRVNYNGWGNRIRSMNGAMFLAAITDRVLLVESDSVSMLFHPPVVEGVELNWDHSLAGGECDGKAAVELKGGLTYMEYAGALIDFNRRYRSATCLVVGAPFGHDRLVATFNEAAYRNKVTQLFGHGTSRYNWSRATLGLVLQRPKEEVVRATADAMRRMELDGIPQSQRIAVHLRTFADAGNRWHEKVKTDIHSKYWDCVETLLRDRIANLQGQQGNANIKVLFISDDPKMKEEAGKHLGGYQVVYSGLPVTHTEASDATIESFLEWFLVGECGTVIATGFSSFGLTAFFRPSTIPPTDSSSKLLYTVDGLGQGITDMSNPKCGQIEAKGYKDINFGLMDPPYKAIASKEV